METGRRAAGSRQLARTRRPFVDAQLPPIRTCKLRIRLLDQKQVAIREFIANGPSKWKMGELRLEWGHAESMCPYDGHLESYNAEVLEFRPFGGITCSGPAEWRSRAGAGTIAGLDLKVLYTHGLEVDRSILTVRSRAGDFSFLPAEAIDGEPIDIPDFGAFIRNGGTTIDRPTYRRQNQSRMRLMEAAARHPGQSIANAYRNMRCQRGTLTFVCVDSTARSLVSRPMAT